MAGTSAGAKKRLATILARPGGKEDLKKWAAIGGKLSSSRVFSTNPEVASKAGKRSAVVRRKNRDDRLIKGEEGDQSAKDSGQ